jgi:hypothetical protein
MGIPDGAHTHGSGGSGLGTALLVLFGAAVAVKLAGPVVATVSEIVYVLMIVVAVLAGVGAAGVVGVVLWRWRHPRPDAARAAALPPRVARGAPPPPEPQRPAIEQPAELHLHLHGVSAEDVAEILRRELP